MLNAKELRLSVCLLPAASLAPSALTTLAAVINKSNVLYEATAALTGGALIIPALFLSKYISQYLAKISCSYSFLFKTLNFLTWIAQFFVIPMIGKQIHQFSLDVPQAINDYFFGFFMATIATSAFWLAKCLLENFASCRLLSQLNSNDQLCPVASRAVLSAHFQSSAEVARSSIEVRDEVERIKLLIYCLPCLPLLPSILTTLGAAISKNNIRQEALASLGGGSLVIPAQFILIYALIASFKKSSKYYYTLAAINLLTAIAQFFVVPIVGKTIQKLDINRRQATSDYFIGTLFVLAIATTALAARVTVQRSCLNPARHHLPLQAGSELSQNNSRYF